MPRIGERDILDVVPQLLANHGLAGLGRAIEDPDRWAIEPKVDGVRELVAYIPNKTLETRNRRRIARDWLRGDGFEARLRRLADRVPILWGDGPRRRARGGPVRRDDGGAARGPGGADCRH